MPAIGNGPQHTEATKKYLEENKIKDRVGLDKHSLFLQSKEHLNLLSYRKMIDSLYKTRSNIQGSYVDTTTRLSLQIKVTTKHELSPLHSSLFRPRANSSLKQLSIQLDAKTHSQTKRYLYTRLSKRKTRLRKVIGRSKVKTTNVKNKKDCKPRSLKPRLFRTRVRSISQRVKAMAGKSPQSKLSHTYKHRKLTSLHSRLFKDHGPSPGPHPWYLHNKNYQSSLNKLHKANKNHRQIVRLYCPLSYCLRLKISLETTRDCKTLKTKHEMYPTQTSRRKSARGKTARATKRPSSSLSKLKQTFSCNTKRERRRINKYEIKKQTSSLKTLSRLDNTHLQAKLHPKLLVKHKQKTHDIAYISFVTNPHCKIQLVPSKNHSNRTNMSHLKYS